MLQEAADICVFTAVHFSFKFVCFCARLRVECS